MFVCFDSLIILRLLAVLVFGMGYKLDDILTAVDKYNCRTQGTKEYFISVSLFLTPFDVYVYM